MSKITDEEMYNKLDNEPGPPRDIPDEDIFRLAHSMGLPPSYFKDPDYGAKYSAWLTRKKTGG